MKKHLYKKKQNTFISWRRGIVLSATFLSFLFLGVYTSGCKKKDNLLGSKAIDPNSLLVSGGVDTFSMLTYTIAEDTVYTKSPRYALLGILNDNTFGTVDVGFYSQVRLSGLNPNFGDISTITIDSFVLAMEYVGGYGYTGTQTFEVFEVNQKMYLDTLYRSTQDLALKTGNWVIGSGSLKVNPNGLTVVGNDTVNTQLRIPLNPAKALQIIQDKENYPAEYGSNTLFTENYLKGIYVKTNGIAPSTNQGMVGYFNLLDQDSKLTIYYKENGVQKPPFDLIFTSECANYNRYKIDNTGKNIAAVVANTSLGQKEFYSQAGKHRAVVKFPTLKNLPNNIVVHAAKLFLPIQYLPNSKFTYPSTISITIKGNSSFYPLTASYDSYQKGYVADIRSYIQNYSIGQVAEDELTISPGTSFISSTDRIVFNGPETDKKTKPKLIISYTKF
ncbi:MAG: DUF4270 domain-containing protein [Crocinitomicaceae bacterium]|nr:DUF4270 domain-containing protein [Crocinitomicaceae bacterium]